MSKKKRTDWLGTPEALKLIHRVAVGYIRFAARHGLPAGSDSRFEPNGQAAKENLQTIESELVLFILENRTGFQRKLLLENRKKGEFLKSAFICFQRENARHKDTDAFRYLYKRTGDTLRNDSRFYTDTGPSGAMDFCMQPHGRRMAPLMAEDVEAILFPHDRIECHDFKSINRKKILIQLATCFWRQVSDMWGKTAVRIDVRDFVKWIDRHIPVGIPQPMSLTSAISDADAPEAPRMDMEIPDPHSRLKKADDDPRACFRKLERDVSRIFSTPADNETATETHAAASQPHSSAPFSSFGDTEKAVTDIRAVIPAMQWPIEPVIPEEVFALAQFPPDQMPLAAADGDVRTVIAKEIHIHDHTVTSVTPLLVEIYMTHPVQNGVAVSGRLVERRETGISPRLICIATLVKGKKLAASMTRLDSKTGSFVSEFQTADHHLQSLHIAVIYDSS